MIGQDKEMMGVRKLTVFDYFFKLHPLKIPEGWTVKKNHLYQKPIRGYHHKLLILENGKNGKIVEVESAKEQVYVMKTLNADQKLVNQMTGIHYDQLAERLEEVIWKEGGQAKSLTHLLRLRIPEGWTVLYHRLTDTNPLEIDLDSEVWKSEFKQELMQLQHDDLILDVKWIPASDPSGHYAVKLIYKGNWEQPDEDFSCIHPKELAYEIDSIFKKVGEQQNIKS
ncbi:hypothetical protein [Bacillus changyiensis]|uniref:hypothetical protein n=1 Tax=Bacillus changyiensis TaxID=3004103 RepID=UPI0022E6CF38|nr:hypothetical protein [Bacillus changyiensis]MDA1476850.1 hypothetical protein [Bacillus changyiensis]